MAFDLNLKWHFQVRLLWQKPTSPILSSDILWHDGYTKKVTLLPKEIE
jgi:hypothetical protein